MAKQIRPILYLAALTPLVGLGAHTATADGKVPKSLRIREDHVTISQARKAQQRRPLRTAQPDQQPAQPAQPTPDQQPTPPPEGATPPPQEPAPPPPEPTPTPPPTPTPTPTPTVQNTPDLSDAELKKLAEEQEKAEGEIIEVTGSMIERRELTTAAPVTVLDKGDLEAAGRATVGDIIQAIPAQSNAVNAQVNNGGDGATRVNIRGLGTNRTLVLLNGRRVVPGGIGADASVDLNAIPLAVIERVEVLKDGASAVYGSDAVGGVVNIITRQDFNGSEANLYTGGSQRGDGFTYDLSFVTGHSSKKGNVIFSAGYQNQRPVFAGDRSFSTYDLDYDFAENMETRGGSSATPSGRIAPGTIDLDGDGKPDGKDLCGRSPKGAFLACKPNGMGGYVPFNSPDDLYNYQPENYLYTPSARYNVFGAGHYNLTKNNKAFFEGLYLNRHSDQQLASEPFLAAVPISAQSIYNNTGGDVYDYRRRLEEFGDRKSFQEVDTFRLVTGLSGKIDSDAPAFKNWKWEVSYNYGHTTGLQRLQGNLILSRLANALGPSFIDANGDPKCGTPGNVIDGCVPMNIMGPGPSVNGGKGSIDPSQAAYVTFTGVNAGFNDQKTALAQASGRVAKLPNNGDISVAVGADYRKEAGGFTPDPLTATGDTTGNAVAPTGGSYNVGEGFAELSVVPVSGLKAAQWFEINLAARAFDYDTFGSGVTWKAGTLFKTAGGVSLRGTYSTAFRAPSVSELYQGNTDNFPAASDPCDTTDGPLTDPVAIKRCAQQGVPTNAQYGLAQQRVIEGGNPKLKAETANVLTAGAVWEPPPVKGLSFTVDYFNIKIKKAIQALGGQVVLANCYSRDIDEDCAKIHRDPQRNYVIDYIDDPLLNVGGTDTDGVDFAVAYHHKRGEAGTFEHQFEGQILHAYTLDNSIQKLRGLGFYDLGVYPRFKANFSTFWTRKAMNAGVTMRYVQGYKECQDNDCNTPENLQMFSRNVDGNFTANLFAGYTVKSTAGVTRLTVGVNNLTDQRPPLIYIGFAGDSDSATYDYMGRFFYARMSHSF